MVTPGFAKSSLHGPVEIASHTSGLLCGVDLLALMECADYAKLS